ncbi:AAA-ATPase At5g17760-like isoform X2 [Fagus crenata]
MVKGQICILWIWSSVDSQQTNANLEEILEACYICHVTRLQAVGLNLIVNPWPQLPLWLTSDIVQVTPAQAAEELVRTEDADTALQGLIKLLMRKKIEGDEADQKKVGIQDAKMKKMENKPRIWEENWRK